MRRLTEQAHELCGAHLQPGDVAIDATAGNGYDTLFLAHQVGPEGTVFAFDIQPAALESTARRLKDHGCENVVLIHRSHAEMQDAIPADDHGSIAAVMFNLGYLPGGEKSQITKTATTLSALEQSLRLLRSGGLLTVLAYPGHPGGDEETAAVRNFFDTADDIDRTIHESAADQRTSPPILFVARKQ